MPDVLEKKWLLEIGGVQCNLYTGTDGSDTLVEGTTWESGRKATCRFICAWEDRNALLAGLLGTVSYQGGEITRTPPFSWPTADRDNRTINEGKQFPNRLFCTDVTDIKGVKWMADEDGSVTGQAGWGYYCYAVLTAEFTSPPYLIEPLPGGGPAFNDLVNSTYCLSTLRVSGEVYSPPTGAYMWAEGMRQGQEVQDAHVGLIRPRYELSVTRLQMPIVPIQQLGSMIGTINETTIQIADNTVSPDAALFMGYNPKSKTDPFSGGIVSDIEVLILVNGFVSTRNADGSWNWFVDPVGDWSGIVSNDGQNTPPFAESDLSQLFSDTIA